MEQHVRILAILHIVWGAIGLVFALALLAVFGGAAALIGITAAPPDESMRFAGPFMGFIAGVVFLFIACLSIPGIVAGIGLLRFKNWARILTIILSALELPSFPFGTALGIYGLWVLLSGDTYHLFLAPQARR